MLRDTSTRIGHDGVAVRIRRHDTDRPEQAQDEQTQRERSQRGQHDPAARGSATIAPAYDAQATAAMAAASSRSIHQGKRNGESHICSGGLKASGYPRPDYFPPARSSDSDASAR